MRIKKLERFAQNKKSKNVIEPGKELYETIAGNWKNYFGDEHDLVVELGCGWGEYTTALAEKFPKKKFIGVDIKGDRVWRGSQYAQKNELSNVAFLRCHIIEISHLFDEDEVDELWLTFPDPQPKDRNEKHRLSNSTFLEKYQHILKPRGFFRFKTDDTFLFEYTLRVLSNFEIKDFEFTYDLYHSNLLDDHFGIKTKYEKLWIKQGKKIKYMKFRFNA
ncbi:MAG: tRNA (guanosine(46)-N7)-methyltransferase TrmB [Bacteroidota bacterium]